MNTPEYFDFVVKATGDICEVSAIVAGAKSLFCANVDFGANEELTQIAILLSVTLDRLDGIYSGLDESTYKYTAKKAT